MTDLKPDLRISVMASDADFIIVDKPAGLPSAPIKEGDTHNALSQIVELFPSAAGFYGKKRIEGGLVHRLDTATRGLLLAALTQNAFENFEKQQKNGNFIKYYFAYCDAYCAASSFSSAQPLPLYIESRFRPYGEGRKKVKPVFENAGKFDRKKAGQTLYRTEVLSVNMPRGDEKKARVLCRINRGFRHQVRAHLASIGLPVIGDVLYNPSYAGKTDARLLFFASALQFNHPVSGERLLYTLEDMPLPESAETL
ncbi:RNA pseudouridine synthase [Treponema sp. HNW]|uniref:pseudouridine synthase n=1 Tax=Treponema sp. HNW TaxID=3116654 RepID=UPI003D102088